MRRRARVGADRLDTLDALWSPDIARQLLTRRSATPGWREADAAEHRGILEAVAAEREAEEVGA